MPVSRSILLLALLACAMSPRAAHATEVPSAQALATMIELMERRALYRQEVDWTVVRAEIAKAAGNAERTRSLLDAAIQRSSRGHGRWVPAAGSTVPGPLPPAAKVGEEADAGQARLGTPPTLDARLGWVTVGRFTSTAGSTSEQARAAAMHAAGLQQRIRDADRSPRCGWIVDLRGNTGGNMWPMLLGTEPLLRIPGDGIQVVGMMRAAGAPVPWELHDGTVMARGRPMLGFGQAGYRLREPGAPVAVLLGPRTGSSGEAIALAFRGRPDSHSFGRPTAGYSTSNSSIRLPDGSLLLLTDAVLADRNGQGDGSRIVPDDITADDAATLAAASHWLLSHRACVEQTRATARAR